jgi:DNA polymerase III alpha subunit
LIRTGFSFGTAVGDVDEVMARLKDIGWSVAPIADRNSTFGWASWTKAAKEHGLRPVYGVEIGVTTDRYAKKPDVDYWTFLAKENVAGVNKLLSLATDQTNHEPLLTYQQAMNAEDVIAFTGSNPQMDEIVKVHRGDVMLSVMPSTPPAVINRFLTNSRAYFDQFVVRPDNRYCQPDDELLYHTICERWSRSATYPQYIVDSGQMYVALTDKLHDHDFATWIVENGEESLKLVLDMCVAQIGRAELYKPKTPFDIRKECERGALERRVDLADRVYAERLERELAVIQDKAFTDYFQIISGVVRWARARMFVGPARGSSCGSLVCYLLGITSVDPIEHALLFERFIDANRSDLPDIDIDFSDQQRSEVFDYIKETYGAGHVARLGTVAIFRARSALAAAGKALSIPSYRTDALADIIEPKALGADDRDLSIGQALDGTDVGRRLVGDFPAIRIATRIQGQPRHYSQHAAGVVLTERPIEEYVAVDMRTGATQCDKYDAEELNLLKVDILGLTQLSILEDCLSMAGLSHASIENWPLDDEMAFGLLNANSFGGIFQFNGRALQGIANAIEVKDFNDIVSITALARPGPLNSGMTQAWIMRKNSENPFDTEFHPLIDKILAPTLGVMTYQEQIMQICREVGGMSWSDVNKVRRGMGKTMGLDYFKPFKESFMAGSISNGLSEEQATKTWTAMVEFGAYAFNKSHSVAYAYISYWCAVLKSRWPMEFFAATLSHMDEPEKKALLLREAEAMGIKYVPFDPDLSQTKWTIGNYEGERKLVGPVSGIVGIGPVAQSEVMSNRLRGTPLSARTGKLLARAETDVDTIYPIRDRIAKLYPDGVPGIVNKIYSISDVLNPNFEGTPIIQCVVVGIKPKSGKYGMELNMFVRDDTGEMFVKVYTSNYDSIAKDIINRGGKGKMIYALKGNVRAGDFRMLTVTKHKFIGDTGK